MFDAATSPPEASLHPGPTDRALPPRVGSFLTLLHTLIAYGRNLADTLRQHAADPHLLPCFAHVAIILRTGDLTLILARISRALLRAAALEERLRRLAARGQDLRDPMRPVPTPKPRKKRARRKPAPRLHDPAQEPSLESPPTLEQIAAEDRYRPIGAVLVDICLDLGIVPNQMDRATWNQLHDSIISYGGDLGTFSCSRLRWPRPADPIPIPVDKHGQPIIPYPDWPVPSQLPLRLREDRAAKRIDGGRGPGP